MSLPLSPRVLRLAGALLAALTAASCGGSDEVPPGGRTEPLAARPDGPVAAVSYVGSDACATCHAEQFAAWSGSQHDLAMQPATEATVLGDFNDARFEYHGIESRFFRKGDRFFVTTDGPDGTLADFEVLYTFGVAPLQQYLVALPGGRLQALGIAWDSRSPDVGGGRWYHLYPDDHLVAGDPLHWTQPYQTWNAMCADCHSTNLQRRYDVATNTYDTTWDEMHVGCEACHGPASAHVAWESAHDAAGTRPRGARLPVDFADHDGAYEVDVCARCHARRHRVNVGDDEPDRPLLDDFVPATLQADLYHADGQIEDEVYVYGSFLQSRMYARGVRCTDCHDAHSLTLRATGNDVCTQCHRAEPPSRFPTLQRKDYDSEAHHFHATDTPETDRIACVDCHMPATTYMGVDARRDHSFRVPRPDLSVKIGTPNACTGCHTDRSAEWAAGAVARWYGPREGRGRHYGEVIAAGRAGAADAAGPLVELASDSNVSGIVRATALRLLLRYGASGRSAAVAAARDPHPLVRTAAVDVLERLPPASRLAALAPLLDDPVRAVRTEAARALSGVPGDRFDAEQRRAFAAALAEYVAVQTGDSDLPGGRFNLALVRASQGQPVAAVAQYRAAIRLDPHFLPAYANLAVLYNQLGRNAEAERVLRDGIALEPEEGELYYSLGLLLAEDQRLEDAVRMLEKAATLLPGRPRVLYNQALALQHLGRRGEAERALRAAHALDDSDQAIVHALAIFYLQQHHWDDALVYARALVALAPGEPEPVALVRQIESMRMADGAP